MDDFDYEKWKDDNRGVLRLLVALIGVVALLSVYVLATR